MLDYNQSSRYYISDTAYDIPQSNMIKTNYDYYETIVQSDESCRLDLVSYRVYNTPMKWWIIARFNAIINPETAIAGTKLKIPVL